LRSSIAAAALADRGLVRKEARHEAIEFEKRYLTSRAPPRLLGV
jgi:hypothetical protein